jgi:hypothetical protein
MGGFERLVAAGSASSAGIPRSRQESLGIARRVVTVGKKTKYGSRGISPARLTEMIEEATVDAYGESEQTTGWFTVIDENLAVPFETTVLGVPVTVERVELNASEQIVAICRRGRDRQALPILDLPLPNPPPEGAEWIEAYRQWGAEE